MIDSFFDWEGLEQHLPTLIRYYYSLPNNGAGGYLHIVLDDGNIDYDSIYFCAEQCAENKDTLGLLICNLLTEFTSEELEQMYERRWDRDN
jgi:hypothetical protein